MTWCRGLSILIGLAVVGIWLIARGQTEALRIYHDSLRRAASLPEEEP